MAIKKLLFVGSALALTRTLQVPRITNGCVSSIGLKASRS